jgi:cell division protein ZapA
VRHAELQRTNALLTSQVDTLTQERDSLKSRLAAARARVDALLDRLPETSPNWRAQDPIMKQLEVQIMGQSYLLGCPEGGDARLLEAVERVDTAMCKIRDGGKVRARDRIAVLAALNLAFDLGDRGVPNALSPWRFTGYHEFRVPAHALAEGEDSLVLATLLSRLDTALGEDGQLL